MTGFNCEFVTPAGKEHYVAESGVGLGLDLEWSDDKVIRYSVLAATTDVRVGHYALTGKYYGAKASATAGVGVGAQVLVGAGDKNISLQPLALEGSTGLGAAAGISYLYLEPRR